MLKQQLFLNKKLPPVQNIPTDPENKLLLLDQYLNRKNYEASWPNAVKKVIADNHFQIIDYTVTIKFEDLTYHEVLEQVLPADITIPTGFD